MFLRIAVYFLLQRRKNLERYNPRCPLSSSEGNTGVMLRGLFLRKPKHERLEEEPEVRFKGSLVSETDLGYTYVRPGGKAVNISDALQVMY